MLGVKPKDEPDQSGKSWIGPAPWIETPPPGPNARALIERDERLSSSSYTRNFPLVVRRGSGSVVEDVDGNRFLDFGAGTAVCATGHCHPRIAAAVEEQARSLIHICGSDFYYPPMIELMEKLAVLAPGMESTRVLLTNSGSEAVEAAIELARHHTKREGIIAFHGAYYGRSMGALSLAGPGAETGARPGALTSMVEHVPYGDTEAIEKRVFASRMAATEVAAVFVEAIQGEGGYIVPASPFLAELRSLCDRHGIVLVCNEIQSGVGRTGKWFAFEHFDVVPDVILMAKGIASGMPLGAVIARAHIMDLPPGACKSTFGGNPVCCAAALATLDLVESGYMANAGELGRQLKARLTDVSRKRKCIANPRGLGLMCAVDIVNRKTGKADLRLRRRLLRSCFERGLILLPCGQTSIRFCPPLCINEAQLDVGLRVFEEGVASTV